MYVITLAITLKWKNWNSNQLYEVKCFFFQESLAQDEIVVMPLSLPYEVHVVPRTWELSNKILEEPIAQDASLEALEMN